MNKLHVLDCTLRDGGYCNEWRFGKQNIRKIIQSLTDAEIDVIECGFLTNRVDYHEDVTKFTDLHQVTEFLPAQRGRKNMWSCSTTASMMLTKFQTDKRA